MWRSKPENRRSLIQAGVCLWVVLLATATLWGGTAPAADADVQAQMRRVVEAVTGSSPDVAARIDHLTEMSPSREALLVQIVLFLRNSGGTEEAMSAALMIEHLRFSDSEKVTAVIPLLDTDDGRLQRVLHDLLGTVDRTDGGEPDFSPYVPLLGGAAPPPGLVRYVYSVSPAAALQALRTANPGLWTSAEDRDLAATETVLRGQAAGATIDATELRAAIDSLERLSGSGVWWIRLYAASAAGQGPSLADEDVLQRLADDEHPLVREAARR